MATQNYTKAEMKLFINPDKITKQQKISLLDLYFEEIGKDNIRVRGTEQQIDAYIKSKGIVLSKYFAEYNSTIIEKTKIEKEEKQAEKKENEEREVRRQIERDKEKIERDEKDRLREEQRERERVANLKWWNKFSVELQESLTNEYCEYTQAQNIKDNQINKEWIDGIFNLEKERGARVERISDSQLIKNGIHFHFGSNKEEDLDKIKSELESDIQYKIVHLSEWIERKDKVIIDEIITIKVKRTKK